MGEHSNKAKGRIKQAVGSLTGDKALVREGEREELEGKIQGVAADAKHAVKSAAKDVKHAVKDAAK